MKTVLCGRRLFSFALLVAGLAGICARADPPVPSGSAAGDTFYPDQPPAPPPPTPPARTLNLQTPPGAANDTLGAPHYFVPEGDPGSLADHLLVVYNSAYPESQDLADYYAQRRHIPAERVLGIACSSAEEITRADYEKTIREPIISYIYGKGWMSRRTVPTRVGSRVMDLLMADHNDIWAIVLMRGVPLKIAEDPTDTSSLESQSELKVNAAAVDSELALLPIFGLPDGGFVPNPFFDAGGNFSVRAGPELALKIILVTRLDAPRAADVRRMIDDSLYAETHRLAGLAVIDTRNLTDPHNAFTIGDTWLRNSAAMLLNDGWPLEVDTSPDVIPPSDPLNHVALYLGWYRDSAYGPWVTPPDRFVRGAIAYHLHSFSARSVRDPNTGWVSAFMSRGAAASMGDVYEPYLFLTPEIDVFTRRLLAGDSFAEAAYACQRGLSWMTTVVGDPLYRPFLVPLDTALAQAPVPSDQHDSLLLQQVRRGLLAGKIEDAPDALDQNLDVPGAGGIALEGLGDLLKNAHHPGDPAEADLAVQGAYRNAENADTEPIDRIRVGLKLVRDYQQQGHADQAQDELKKLVDAYPGDAARFGIVTAPAPAPAPPPPAQLAPVSGAAPVSPPSGPNPR
jgi:uncharacterized protein (TIGR03790 family)